VKAPVILVIEDNPRTRKIVRLTLGNEGFTVIEAGDGAEALVLASNTLPDLILQDLLLPDMDGFALVSRLRARPELVGVPIIAFSGFLSRLEHGRAAAAGFTDFMPKPVEPSRLLQVVRTHLPPDLGTPEKIGRGQHVLVADDDPVQLKLTRIRLTGLGLTVATATNGVEALEVLQREGTEAVVSDVLMPRLDGFSLCTEVRKDPRFSQLPIILVSSNYIDHADRELALKMGATAFVVRTPSLTEMVWALDVALNAPSDTLPPSVHADPTEHHERVLRQLERQVAMNAACAHRSSMHASMLSVVAGMSECLTKRQSAEDAAPDILGSLLEASGVSMGAFFERHASAAEAGSPASDDLNLRAHMGFSDAVGKEAGAFFGHREIFERAVASKSPMVVGLPGESQAGRDLLARAGLKSALLVPFLSHEECLGILLLASEARDLTESDWIPFARTIAVQIGQALSLGRAFSLLEREVIERKQAESATRRERDRARKYLDTAEVLLLATDVEGRVTLINRKGCDLLGWTEHELLGRDFIEMCLPARVRIAHREQHQSVLRGDVSVIETPVLTRSGEERLIEWHNSTQHDDAGNVIGTFSSGTDITERSQAVEALRTAEERMRFALEAAGVGIWDMDYTSGVLRWSETIEAHYGLQPGTFEGTFDAFVERLHPDDRATVLEAVGKAVKTGSDFSTRHRAIWPDGTVRWLAGAGRILLGEQGEPVRGIGISMDITERRTLEEQFQQAQKMEAVGRLAGGIAHDFNNLLTVILGFCELSVAGLDAGDPRQADLVEIQSAGERAAGLTRQLLAFSRKQIIEPTLVDLNDVVHAVLPMLARLIGEDVRIEWVPQHEPALVIADRGQVEQIVMNLAVNARDAMPKGGMLTIDTRHVDLDEHYATSHPSVTPGSYVALTVTDTGTGMTPEVQARLFEPFFTTKEPGKGTGLGLATVHGIVARGGGNVGVYSEVGRGTSIKVHFPKAEGEKRFEPTAAPAASPRDGTQTVLVVEDEAGLRVLARRLLQRLGYTVLVAADAGEARRLFAEHPSVDVLLTDVVMPGASGADLGRQLIDLRPDLRVVYMSGYTEEAIVRHGVLAPGIAFLHKPFTSQTLGGKIREVLER
jgi:PAS domain S-box-containing protein